LRQNWQVNCLIRALNAQNRNGQDYHDIFVDRKIGPITLRTLEAFIEKRGPLAEGVLTKAIDALQGMNAYLNGSQEPLYALFGVGYPVYTVAR